MMSDSAPPSTQCIPKSVVAPSLYDFKQKVKKQLEEIEKAHSESVSLLQRTENLAQLLPQDIT